MENATNNRIKIGFGWVFFQISALKGTLLKVAVLLLILIALAFVLTPSDDDFDYHFVEEDGLITVLSSFFLASAAAFSFVGRSLGDQSDKASIRAWSILAIGFAFLSIDEVFQIHEQLGWLLEDYFDSGIFRNWNDVIVIGYGLAAIPILWLLLPSVKNHKAMMILLALGFGFYTLHTVTDSVVEDSTTLSIIIEESFKLTFVILFSFAAYSGMSERLSDSGRAIQPPPRS
ncbi:MAG: hypothetical protein O3B41_08885 [Bacteroidetes bacterium]|nr:hypothetical protein [Bacteroidota bacterium]